MGAMLLVLVASSTVQVTSGWPLVVDLEGVRSVTSEDERVVVARALEADQLLLVGGVPGVTKLWVTRGETREAYDVSVSRAPTFFPRAAFLKLEVGVARVERVAGLRQVISGDAGRCDARLTGSDEVTFAANAPGLALVVVWLGGLDRAHRRELLINVEAGVARTVDDEDAVLTEPLDGRLVLVEGEHARLDLVSRAAVTDETVISLRRERGALVVAAKRAGVTWLVTWHGARPERRLVVVAPHTPWSDVSADKAVVPLRDASRVR